MRYLCLVAAVLALADGEPAQAASPQNDDAACDTATTTAGIAACLGAEAKAWDRKLNAAYAALQERIDPGQREPLRAAQRLWIQYRDANCRFYGAREGSVRQIEAAECLRSMTRDRARELTAAMAPQ
ncbi:MAG TPA: lysozyme inhibitor LprI family protein [Roseomonas sp.]|nr:lysozyme inhibitor LprI family protein [Roseomonas sp.]